MDEARRLASNFAKLPALLGGAAQRRGSPHSYFGAAVIS